MLPAPTRPKRMAGPDISGSQFGKWFILNLPDVWIIGPQSARSTDVPCGPILKRETLGSFSSEGIFRFQRAERILNGGGNVVDVLIAVVFIPGQDENALESR